MADFSVSVKNAVEKAKDRADAALRGTATAALARVKELTPVDTGNLRQGFSATTERFVLAKPDSDTGIAKAKIGDVIHIVNPVKYARRVEYGFIGTDSLGREYHQTGRHMVAQTMLELPKIAREVVADLKR